MKIINTISEMQNISRELRKKSKTIAFVPTMGFLHEGHLSLIDMAHKYSDFVVVSIFVNPTQFAPNEDLDAYPKDFERDSQLCETRNVDIIFAPQIQEIYPENASTFVFENQLSLPLCGETRSTHFQGVTTIVAKLFNIVLPDFAVFGLKDYQQLAVIKRMVRDLNFPIKIIASEIVRESDGLAMSSRNKYLSESQRQDALSLNRALFEVKKIIESNPIVSIVELKEMINLRISQTSGLVDYIEFINPYSLQNKNEITGEILIALAVFFDKTRLIDNMLCKVK